jgi:hypothetical protein
MIDLTDECAQSFIKLDGIALLQNFIKPYVGDYAYKIVAALCAKPLWIDYVLTKSTIIPDIIKRIDQFSAASIESAHNSGQEESIELILKVFEKIVKRAKGSQVSKFANAGALEALTKHLGTTMTRNELIYGIINKMLGEARMIDAGDQNSFVARMERVGLQRHALEWTRQVVAELDGTNVQLQNNNNLMMRPHN